MASDGQTRSYGPLPRIYQLAVLHQLKSNDPERRDAYDQRINKVFRRAVEVMRIPSLVNETARKIRLQGDSFNMLELASFFLELPYDKLRGLADETPSQFDISGTWQLVSNDESLTPIRYTKPFAEAELESLLRENPTAVGFRLDESGMDGNKSGVDGKWTIGCSGEWVGGNGKQICMLANLLFHLACRVND